MAKSKKFKGIIGTGLGTTITSVGSSLAIAESLAKQNDSPVQEEDHSAQYIGLVCYARNSCMKDVFGTGLDYSQPLTIKGIKGNKCLSKNPDDIGLLQFEGQLSDHWHPMVHFKAKKNG